MIDTEAHEFPMLWWNRMIADRSYVQGLEDRPEPLMNQDLANIWLDEEPMDDVTRVTAQAPPV